MDPTLEPPARLPRTRPDRGRTACLAKDLRQCRYCDAPVTGRRRTFCSAACVHEWRLRTDPSYVRKQVWHRDHGRCACCGVHTPSLRAKWNRLPPEEKATAEAEFGLRKGKRGMWDADHIVPVALGGGQCGLDGYRTLCLPCHKAATAALREKLKRASVGGDR
jgi:5-methylcytosine-specific restriction endonuclease McrA